MAQATDTVWLPVLPSMKGFGPALVKQGSAGAAAGGKTLGMSMGKAMALGLAASAAVVGGAGAILYQTGKTFEEMSNTIRVGTGATGDALTALESSAKTVGKNVPASFDEIGTAIADINTRTGLTGKPLENMTTQFLELSRITGTDVADNIKNATRVFGDWGIEADDQADTLDHLFKVSQTTGIGVDELSTKVVDNGAVFRQLGFSFEESTALLGKFEKEGVNGGKVMSGMTQSLGRMAKAGEDPIETFKRVSEEIKTAGSVGEANGLALELFGSRAGPDMAAAIREGRFELGDLMDTLDASGETILTAGEDTMTFTEEWQKFKNNVLVWLEPMGARVFGALGDLMADVVDGVKLFGDAWEGNAGKVSASGLPGFMQDLGTKARAVFDYMQNTAIPAIRDFGGWLNSNKQTIGIVAGVITAVMLPALVRLGVSSLVNGGKAVAGWVMQQGAAVKAGAVYVVQSFKIIGTWVAMGLAAIRSGAQTVAIWALYKIEAIKAAGVYVVQRARIIGSWLAMSAAAVASGIRTAAVWTGMVIASAARGAARFVLSAARVVGGWALMAVQSLLQAARMAAAWFIALGPIGWVTAAVIAIAALVIANWDRIKRWTISIWTAVKNWVIGAWVSIRDRTMQIVGAVVSWVTSKFTAFRDTTSRVFGTVRDRIASVWNSIRDKISDTWNNRIKPVFQAFGDFIKDKVVGKIKTGVDQIGSAWRKVANIFRKPINWVIREVWNGGIAKAFNTVADKVGLPDKVRIGDIPQINAFAKGGLARPGWALVGEEGPELVNFSNPGRVYTAAQTRKMNGDVPEGESVHPMGGIISWIRGGLAKAAEGLLKPLVSSATSKMREFGAMGELGGGLVDFGVDKLISWVRGKDTVEDAGGAEYTGPMQNGRAYRPAAGPITSWYGMRGGRLHGGVDFAGALGSAVYAIRDGVVHSIQNYSGSGHSVNLSHGGGSYSHYGHNRYGGIPVGVGDSVKAGQRIGTIGMTGRTTGPHVHLETWQGGMWNRRNPNALYRDNGGPIYPGLNMVQNNTGKLERTFNDPDFQNLRKTAEIAVGQGNRPEELHYHAHSAGSQYQDGSDFHRWYRRAQRVGV